MSFKEITDIILKASKAQQTEIVVVEQDDSLTRFANNTIHQNVTERNTNVVVRSVIGRRVGIATSNDVRRESLEGLAQRAFELAKLSPENPEFKSLPSPQAITSAGAMDRKTAECSPEERARRVGAICGKAKSAGYTAAGSMRTMATRCNVANSLGVLAQTESSIADVSLVVLAPDSSGWAQASSGSVDSIDAEALADEGVRKARIGAGPIDCPPAEYTVILDPYATADVVGMLAFDGMGAMSVQEERSWLNGRIGKKIMADSVSIVDDGLDPRGLPMPFDFEGVPKRRVPIVDAGVPTGPVYDSFTAGREANGKSTGHALPPSPTDRYGPLPMNLFLQPGTSSVPEMIRSTKMGLYITRFWYTRPVHPRDAVITGMTRDGTYVVKDGEIAYPVKSLRFTQSYVDALKNVEALGSVPQLLWSDGFTFSVPALKIAQFRFTSGTR
jgi:PmbA protein